MAENVMTLGKKQSVLFQMFHFDHVKALSAGKTENVSCRQCITLGDFD